MFILIQPMYSKQEINADSNYIFYSTLVRAMLKIRPDWHWITLFPDAKSGYKYSPDGFFDLPNITRVAQRISPRKRSNAVSYDACFYDKLLREYAIDAILCNLIESAGLLAYSGDTTNTDTGIPAVIASHHWVIHPSLPYVMETIEHIRLLHLHGTVLADANVFNTDYTWRMVRDNMAKYLSDETIKRVEEKSCRIYQSTLEDSLKYHDTRNDVPVIAYNHRINDYKKPRITFGMLEELYREGVKFRVKYMNNTRERSSIITHYPFVEFVLCKDRTTYLKELMGCDLNVTNSVYETFCNAAVESMALGQPVVAPNSTTFPEITGRNETKYPYLFAKVSEQKEMVRKLLTNRGERKRWGKTLSDYVRKNFNATKCAQQYAELFEKYTTCQFATTPQDALDMLKSVVKKCDGMELHELRKRVYSSKIGGRQPFANQSMNNTRLIRMGRYVGGSFKMKQGKQIVVAP